MKVQGFSTKKQFSPSPSSNNPKVKEIKRTKSKDGFRFLQNVFWMPRSDHIASFKNTFLSLPAVWPAIPRSAPRL